MRIIIFVVTLIFLFGCFGEEGVEPPVQENETNETDDDKPVTVIIGEQENQTAEGNITQEQNQTQNVSTEMEYEYDPEQPIGIYFIDVGDVMLHGDAILIKKGDLDILVDAGPQQKAGVVVDFLRSRSVDDIEILISTNADPRHYGGIEKVANNFEIESLWWTDDTFGDSEYLEAINKVKAEVKETNKVWDGHKAEYNGINFEVLNPAQLDRFEDVNNDAMVIKVTDRNFSMLLTSGIQTGAQGVLINEKPDKIKSQIIQAPYYGVGAGTSNIGIFIIKAEPEVMIISGSADDSPENGGSREPFERLMEQHGVTWYANYEIGAIRIISDGQDYSIDAVEN